MRSVNIGLIGLGTIGRGVYDAIIQNGNMISRRAGVSLSLKGVCDRDPRALKGIDKRHCPVVTDSADELIKDPGIDIIVELIGGLEPAGDIILKSISGGKHVVTANKALLSARWKEIFEAASRKGVFVKFEASVGGGIPVIRSLRESLVANRFDKIYGILNGTTNFILSMMADKGSSFKDALKTAQEKGIAEADPELDVSGKDAAHKLSILSLLGFGVDVPGDSIFTEGITSIGPQDLRNASRWGYSVKLLAIARDSGDGLSLRVHPTLIPSRHLLSGVKGEDNAVFVKGDLVGEALLFGKGAGRKPTASSVMGDIVEIAGHLANTGRPSPVFPKLNYDPDKKLKDMEDLNIPFYLRFTVIDKPGVLAGISSVLSENKISIASVSQEERKSGKQVPVIILTHSSREGDLRKAIQKIDSMDFIKARTVVIRIEE
ncbi:MAG: homoserine dehydrogenase [Candidatus Omnitrophica bacterium]|nr:homoserine dehydrogenase [Candidatus Omnitrophota bacterium]